MTFWRLNYPWIIQYPRTIWLCLSYFYKNTRLWALQNQIFMKTMWSECHNMQKLLLIQHELPFLDISSNKKYVLWMIWWRWSVCHNLLSPSIWRNWKTLALSRGKLKAQESVIVSMRRFGMKQKRFSKKYFLPIHLLRAVDPYKLKKAPGWELFMYRS